MKDDGILIFGLMFLMVIWGGFTTFMIPKGMGLKYNLPSDITLFVILLMFFFIPYNVMKKENGYKYSLLLKFIGVIGTIILCPWRDGTNKDDLYMVVSMINYDLIFMA